MPPLPNAPSSGNDPSNEANTPSAAHSSGETQPSGEVNVAPEAQRMIQRFAQRFDELRATLVGLDPLLLAQRCGAAYEPAGDGGGLFRLRLWGAPITISYPDYQVFSGLERVPATLLDQAFLLYYLTTADGAPLQNRWIAFSDLPDGRFYNQAFQGYTGKELARHFGGDHSAFEHAALALGGAPAQHADAAFTFQALPRVPVMVAYWLGDEDFPSTCQILFDAAAGHYLPSDAYAILGSTLTRRLIKVAK